MNSIVTPSSSMRFMRCMHLVWKNASPTASASSTIRISGCTLTAIANASRTYIPEE